MKNTILEIKQIIKDKRLFPREHVDEKVVKEYAKNMEKGNKFPPVYVGLYKGKYYLIDGRHRLEAYETNGERFVQAEVKDNFPDFESMFLAAIRANISHGLRLTEQDKLKVAYQLKDMSFNLEDISQLVGISLGKLDSNIQHKVSNIVFHQKLNKGEIPERISEVVERKKEYGVGIVDESKGEVMDNKDIKKANQILELKNIYNYLKAERFYKDQKIATLIFKIKKLIETDLKWMKRE